MSPGGGDALFVDEGTSFVPTELARGPWTPDALHGGPVAALVTRALESCAGGEDMQLCRLTLELLRPVPVAPLELQAVVTRPGAKVQVLEATLTSAGVEIARGRGLRLRAHRPGAPRAEGLPAEVRTGERPGPSAPRGPHSGHQSPPLVSGYRAFHNAGAELRFVEGEFDRRGPAAVWVRLAVPVVWGEEPSAAQRAAAAADFGNGVSSVLDFERYVFINPDLTLYLARPPRGEWVCLRASTSLGTPGIGLAQSELWDEAGIVGRSLQSLVVERRS